MLLQKIRTISVAFENSKNNILHRIPPPALPEFTSVKSICDLFSRYFVDKIETFRSKFSDKVQNIPQVQ